MPTLNRIKFSADGAGAYSLPVTAQLYADAEDNDSESNQAVWYTGVYREGILPGWALDSKAYQGTDNGFIIRGVYLVADSTITGTGSSGAGATANLNIYRSGSSAVTAATLAFDTGVDATAFVAKELTISTTQANYMVRWGDVLVFNWAQGSTGLALPTATLCIDIL